MVMPSKYRQKLQADCSGQLLVTIDRDKCLLLYPMPEWEKIETVLTGLSTLDRKNRRIQRLMLGHATEVEMDGNGRVRLPQVLRDFADLDKQFVLVGQGHKFELWNEEVWNRQRDLWLEEESDDDAEISAELRDLRF